MRSVEVINQHRGSPLAGLRLIAALVCAALTVGSPQAWSQAAPTATATPGFGVGSLFGNCALQVASNVGGQTRVMSGQLVFDGTGKISASLATNSQRAAPQPLTTYSGTYTANPDGTGTISIIIGAGSDNFSYGANSGSGTSVLQLIESDPGERVRGAVSSSGARVDGGAEPS